MSIVYSMCFKAGEVSLEICEGHTGLQLDFQEVTITIMKLFVGVIYCVVGCLFVFWPSLAKSILEKFS